MKKEKFDFIYDLGKSIYCICPSIPQNVTVYIACQMALESDFGSSKLTKEHSNFSGMKRPKKRITTNIGIGDFASYHCYEHCIVDYLLCLSWHHVSMSDFCDFESFKKAISWYCPEKDYFNKIDSLYNDFFNTLKLKKNEQN